MVSLTRCELELLEDIYYVGNGELVNVEIEAEDERDQEVEDMLAGNWALIEAIRTGQYYFTKILIKNNEAIIAESWGKTKHDVFFKRTHWLVPPV